MTNRSFFAAAMLTALFFASSARADIAFNSVGILAADSVQHFSGMQQYGVLFDYSINSESDSFWMPDALNLGTGWLQLGSDVGAFISFGPVYRWDLGKKGPGRWFAEFSFQPTLISDSNFGGKELGGNLFGTSYIGLGTYIDRQRKSRLLLRYQHMSNGNLNPINPGVDMVGLSINYAFGGGQ